MSKVVLRLEKVTKIFSGKDEMPSVEIFKKMDFNIKRSEIVGLFFSIWIWKNHFSSACRFIR